MISTDISTRIAGKTPVAVQPISDTRSQRRFSWHNLFSFHRMMWVCMLLACLGTGWFTYQYTLVPQPKNFTPNWQGSQWVQAVDGSRPVTYFRYKTSLNVLPDGASATVAANQVFRLYVNGVYVATNSQDFAQGKFPHAYMLDIASFLRLGTNAIALRVVNFNNQPAAVRVQLTTIRGNTTTYSGTDSTWQGAVQSTDIYPRYAAQSANWTDPSFNTTSWHSVRTLSNAPNLPLLDVNPSLYERPIPTTWLSVGSGQDMYLVRHLSVPFGSAGTWLRLVATGNAYIFINGNLRIVGNSQSLAPILHQSLTNALGSTRSGQFRAGLPLGVYDITHDLHPGDNTIAIHISAPGTSAARIGLDTLRIAASVDILLDDMQQHETWLTTKSSWHASSQPVPGWAQGNTAFGWPMPLAAGRPGTSRIFYGGNTTVPHNLTNLVTNYDMQITSPFQIFMVIALSSAAVLGLWLCMALFVLRRYYRSRHAALATLSLAYLPALAAEGILMVIAREPHIRQPLPYTWFWAVVLLALVALGYLVLWYHARLTMRLQSHGSDEYEDAPPLFQPFRTGLLQLYAANPRPALTAQYRAVRHLRLRDRILPWLRLHWALVVIVLLVIPCVTYNIGYEMYWQDELSSYNAARGILAHGIPIFPSGFIYTKAELFSYLLALWMALFGTQGGSPRLLTGLEYLVSLPVFYFIARYFSDRRIALLATAMLAFSPMTLFWSRQVRMYEQAQLLTLVVVYLFYKALQERQKIYLVYLAVGCLVLDYLSHEEVFIIFPAVVVCVLLASREKQHLLPWIVRQKHWWYAAVMGGSIIGLQLLAGQLTHPTVLGTDQSQQPFIQFTMENIPYYTKQLFFPNLLGQGTLPWLMLNSLLATVGCFWAIKSTSKPIKYCALFLVVSLLTLVLMFTMQADRYIYPLLPLYYLIGAYALMTILRIVWGFARAYLTMKRPTKMAIPTYGGYLSWPMAMMVWLTTGLICATVLVAPMFPLNNYNLFVSTVGGFSYHKHYPDYDAAGRYVQQHMRKGDIVITVSPGISLRYYLGHIDYFFSTDRALYLFEQNGHLRETAVGLQPLLNQGDFNAVLATHPRVWIISDNGQNQASVAKRFTIPPEFHIVFEGYSSAVFSRGN